MRLNPEVQIVERLIQEAKQRYESGYFGSKRQRKNNRKNTRSRKTQFITCLVKGSFPPMFNVKCVKHPSK